MRVAQAEARRKAPRGSKVRGRKAPRVGHIWLGGRGGGRGFQGREEDSNAGCWLGRACDTPCVRGSPANGPPATWLLTPAVTLRARTITFLPPTTTCFLRTCAPLATGPAPGFACPAGTRRGLPCTPAVVATLARDTTRAPPAAALQRDGADARRTSCFKEVNLSRECASTRGFL